MASSYNLSCMGAGGIPFTISGYLATDAAANVYMNLDMNQPAAAASPTDIIVPRNCVVSDIVASVTVTGTIVKVGMVEIIAGGKGTGVFIDLASRGPASAGRMAVHIPLRAGTQFRVKVVTTLDDV